MKGKNVKRILTTATAAAATLVLILAVNVATQMIARSCGLEIQNGS